MILLLAYIFITFFSQQSLNALRLSKSKSELLGSKLQEIFYSK